MTSVGVTVTVSNTAPGTQSPYGGTAVIIPGTIQAEDFDNGGEGVAYHDSDSANNGGLYRPNESVDIKAASDTGGGYAIGWIVQPNEWFEYTVNVASSGTFTFAARVATIYSGKSFHVEIDGVNVTVSLGVPVTGSAWDTTWGTVTKSGINLTAGPHIMRVVADTDLFDLNYFTWTAQATADTQAPSTPGGLSASALSSSQVALSWLASTDNVGVAGYTVFRNGVKIGTVNGTSFSDSGLIASTTYTYSVRAFDVAGNISAQASMSITTHKFVIGDRIKANVSLTVRSKPSTSSSSRIRGTQPTGALGRIIGGPQIGSGYTWWRVDFNSGADGWVVQSGIAKQ